MTKLFYIFLRRELLLAIRSGTDTLGCVLFFILCSCLFPLALGPSPTWLHQTGPGIIWVCALLSSLLPLEKLFATDFDDGSLDLLMTSELPPIGIAFVKMISHWITSALPILLSVVLMGFMFHLNKNEIFITLISLLLGSITFSLIGGMIAATILGARKSSILLPLLVLPLTTPPLIFGAAASYTIQLNISASTSLSLLGAFVLIALPLCPLAASVSLREACR